MVNCRGYTQETALSRRVKDWEDKIRPELLLQVEHTGNWFTGGGGGRSCRAVSILFVFQEERPVFDIHDYGDRVVGALTGVGHRRRFSSVVHGLDNFEACKYLLASLQLVKNKPGHFYSYFCLKIMFFLW